MILSFHHFTEEKRKRLCWRHRYKERTGGETNTEVINDVARNRRGTRSVSGKLGGQSTVPASPRWPQKDLMMRDIRMPVHLISPRLLSTYYQQVPVLVTG